MICPKCGGREFKSVTESVQQSYKKCNNPGCNYAPALEHAEPIDASTWALGIAKEHAERNDVWIKAEQELHDIEKPTTLHHGRLAKAKRLLDESDKKMHIAEALSEVVGATESGQITVIIPELGMYQFEWGEFNLFKAIDKVQKEAK